MELDRQTLNTIFVKLDELRDMTEKNTRCIERLDESVKNTRDGVRSRVKEILDLVHQHQRLLEGDAVAAGLRMKVDRLEQAEKKRDRWIAAIGAASVGTFVDMVQRLFHSKAGL